MADDAKRVEIGFAGGQVMSVRLTEEQIAEVRRAVEGGGWLDIDAEEGRISLDLETVVFVRAAGGPHAIGFSNA